MAIYDLGTASLAANGEVTGVGTTWKAPLTLIRVGATIVFKTEPVQIYTISEIISDTQVNVYNPNSETVPAGTGYAILAHDGITVQGLAQDVAETLRYYQSRETEVADAVDAFNNFDLADFDSKVTQVNTQHGDVVTIGAQVSEDSAQVTDDKNSAAASAASASSSSDAAAISAQEAADYAASLNTESLLRKDLNLSDISDKISARLNLSVYSSSEINSFYGADIKTFGAVGDGLTDDSQVVISQAESGSAVLFGPGSYLITSNVTFKKPVKFENGAKLVIRNGASVRFDSEIIAGLYEIFDTTDDFVQDYLTVPSVKIPMGPVRPEWFGAVAVNSYNDLAGAVDCASAFHKAWHATCGEFNVVISEGSFYQSEFYHSWIQLCAGKYRINKRLKLWHRVTSPTTVRYNKNGGGIIGEGMGLSVIVQTNSSDENNAIIELSDMSGEMHIFKGFKVTFFDPSASGDARYFGRNGAGLLISSSDSVYTYDIWAAGLKYLRTDANGVRRGGVGIQFESLVDHFFGNLLVEHCVNGICFSSCVSNGTSIKGFSNDVSDLAFGNYIPAWPNLISQSGINLVSVSGLESKANRATPIFFGTKDNRVSLSGVLVKGNGESSTTSISTYRVIAFNTAGGGASGSIHGNVMNVQYGLIDDSTTGFAGDYGRKLKLDFNIYNVTAQSSSETGVCVFRNQASNVDLKISVSGSIIPCVINYNASVVADISCSSVAGQPSANYSAFICGGNARMTIRSISVSSSTSNGIGYVGGAAKVLVPAIIDSDNLIIRKSASLTGYLKQVSSSDYLVNT